MASCVRFLQCAGFRFDSLFWDGPEGWAAQRNNDLWQTFQAVLSLCQSEKIEFLFIAGDLFEQEYVLKETVERVARSLAKLEGTKIFITPGKRDPLIITSAYRLTVWPTNVHIFSSGVSSVKIPSHNVTVTGAGWTAFHQERPFLDCFQAKNDGSLQFMLLHAKVDSDKSIEGFIPVRQEQIASSGLDYLALGNREVWSGIQQAGETFWADCGVVESRSFLNGGPHGVLLGEIEKESSHFEFRELGQRNYIEKDLLIEPEYEIVGVVAKLLAETSLEERQKNLFRIKLAGKQSDLEGIVQALQYRLEAKFRFVEVVLLDNTITQSKLHRVSAAKSYKSYPSHAQLFKNRLKERVVGNTGSETKEYWELVQRIGLTALEQGRIFDED